MKPGDRLEARVMHADMPETLKWDILNSLKWYRQALYSARQETNKLEHKAYLDSWKTNPDRMGGSFSDHEIAEASTWR